MARAWKSLKGVNTHPRDDSITFQEKSHTYYINGNSSGVVSVTKLIHCFFPEFNAVEIIRKMQESPKWPSNKYFGRSAEDIQEEWNRSGREASSAGTKMHLAIEKFMNGAEETISSDVKASREWTHFSEFWKDFGNELEPYRTEWEVWVEEIKLAGSIDCVFRKRSDNTFVIYDWKRSKEIKTENEFESGMGPLEHLPNSNYWHYTIQLNMYRWILEKYYGLKISDMYLIILHPNNTSYHRMRLNRMDDEIENIIQTRLSAVQEGGMKVVKMNTLF